jgi:hypothetical protein
MPKSPSVKKAAEAAGARCAESKHWLKGGEGALEFADAVIDACNEKNDFKFLYPLEMKLRDRVDSSPRKSTAPTAWIGLRKPPPRRRCWKKIPSTPITPP